MSPEVILQWLEDVSAGGDEENEVNELASNVDDNGEGDVA